MSIEPKKELGQNFLVNMDVVDTLVNSAEIQATDTVVEIGPGLGAVTQKIITKLNDTGKLYAVETDPRMIEYLKEDFSGNERLELIFKNALDWLPDFRTDKEFKMVASLPFYITSPLLHAIIHMDTSPSVASLLIQKEVAQKLCRNSPDASYLSVFVQTFYDVSYIATVKKNSFDPVPQVDGAIVLLKAKPVLADFLVSTEQKKKYSRFLHKGFASPRKMMNKQFDKDDLQKADIDPSIRPQDIGTEDWLKMFTTLALQ